jgi:hypothetical protein
MAETGQQQDEIRVDKTEEGGLRFTVTEDGATVQMKVTPIIEEDGRSGMIFSRFDDEFQVKVLMSYTSDGFEISNPNGNGMSFTIVDANTVDVV